MKKVTLLAAILAASVGTAQAQTVFDGGYYGFGLGYGNGEVTNFDGTGNLTIDGPIASGYVGWNASSGNVVYGVEADLSFGNVQGDALCVNPTWTCDAKVKALGTVRGRLGVAQGNTLFYATAGGAAGSVTLKTINSVGTEFPDTQTATGWVAGIGVEGQWGASPWRYRAEYLYHDLGSKTYTTDVPYTAGTTVGLLRIGVAMSF